jgi:small subunit ribosomal protein S19e
MVNAYDVPAEKLIGSLVAEMKSTQGITPAQWSPYVKTGSHAERPPSQADWWYVRAASLLRKVYVHGPVGETQLESTYGGTKALAYYPKHHRDAGGSIIRKILQQLEQAGLVAKTPRGRVLTPKGTALLDKVSKQVFDQLTKENAALARYG